MRTPNKKRLAAVTLFTLLVGSSPALAHLTDPDSHPPPLSGPYSYYPTSGAFGPDQPGFPALGETYIDPVFGNNVRRLSKGYPGVGSSTIYARNGFWNADGTRYAHNPNSMGTIDIIDTLSGAVVAPGVPWSQESSFDPSDPEVFYSFSGADLKSYSLGTSQQTTVKTFGAPLESLGASVDWIDASGRYMLLNLGGTLQVWDKQADALYAGGVPATFGPGWAGISPDGRYVIVAGPGAEYVSYSIDHAGKTLSTQGTSFWTLCGDHGDLVSASDGKTYLVTFECYSKAAVYRVDVTIPQTAADVPKQQTDNQMLFDTDWPDAGHMSCAASGVNRDWCFVSLEAGDDSVTDQGPWRPYKQEIIAANVVTGEVRRLAHHRSRGLVDGGYCTTPRVNASWDGSRAMFASNFGAVGGGSCGYSDVYAVDALPPGAADAGVDSGAGATGGGAAAGSGGSMGVGGSAGSGGSGASGSAGGGATATEGTAGCGCHTGPPADGRWLGVALSLAGLASTKRRRRRGS